MYDINGILCVSVKSCTGEIKEKEIVNEKLHLSNEELERSKEKLNNIIQNQFNFDENELIKKLVWLFQFASPFEKQHIGFAISNLENAYFIGIPIICKKTYERIKEMLKEFEYKIAHEIDFENILNNEYYDFGYEEE